MSDILAQVADTVLAGQISTGKRLTEQAIRDGISAKDILDRGLVPGMEVVGRRFRNGDMFVPEVLMAAKTMQASMDLIKPLLVEAGIRPSHKVVIGTVKGDMHDIGKNLVAIMLQGAGFEVIDLGTNVSPDRFVLAMKEQEASILGMSALLTTTLNTMGETIKAIKDAGLRDRVRIMVGGAPVTKQFADEIGADGYGSNAGAAVELAKRLVSVPV